MCRTRMPDIDLRGTRHPRLSATVVSTRIGSIPGCSARVEESQAALPPLTAVRTAEPLIELAAHALGAEGRVLQVPPHRVVHQNGILRKPGRRMRSQQPVLPRPAAELRETCVDTSRIGREKSALLLVRALYHGARYAAEAKQPGLAILIECHLAKELGEL